MGAYAKWAGYLHENLTHWATKEGLPLFFEVGSFSVHAKHKNHPYGQYFLIKPVSLYDTHEHSIGHMGINLWHFLPDESSSTTKFTVNFKSHPEQNLSKVIYSKIKEVLLEEGTNDTN